MTRTRFLSNCCTLFIILICGVTACKPSAKSEQTSNISDAVEFPHKVQARYAKGFRITYQKNYKLLEILNPFQNRRDTLRYSLVPRELADKINIEDTREVAIPIRSMIATSTTHIGLTDMLNANDLISGMVGAEYIYNKEVNQKLDRETITNFPMGEFNKEQALELNPDLLMISGGQSSQFDNYQVLMDSGINVLVNAEWLEKNPLGKAEWIKVMAALLNKEKLANKKFTEVENRYKKLSKAVKDAENKPLVINNLPYKGSWFVSGGNSYFAALLKDAGAEYPWYKSKTTGGLQKDFEVIYKVGLNADVWLNPGAAKTKEDILAKDQRFRDFKPFQTNQIYNNNKRVRPSGGNDFWESGAVHPEIILADLIKIFHPQVLPNHRLYYYQKVN